MYSAKKITCVITCVTCASRKRRGKTPRQICYVRYYEWTLKIMTFQREDSLEHYNYLEKVLTTFVHCYQTT